MSFFTMQYNSAALGRGNSLIVILPDDGMSMVQHQPPYKTVYFLTGFSVDNVSLATYLPFRRECELKGIAAVLISGENAFYQDHPERGACYGRLVGQEVVEETRKRFPLSTRREDTFIAGISMGGYGALLTGLNYCDTFSKVAAFSPACSPENLLFDFQALGLLPEMFYNHFGDPKDFDTSYSNLNYAYPKADRTRLPEIFISCGTGDGLVYPTVQRFMNTLTEAEIPFTFRETTGNHEMDCWERMMDPSFSFLAGIPEGTKDRLVLGF